ncbi:MAG: DUF11 domain-containing protein [Caldilineaceae bacterium]|nr:DUF11 domain-containing protein [Caldilineaceae bacterium]MBP8109748.1 DUF11 domain-containing protein [Caldilineaceae bacterium]MBP8124342.1 DUF11 domain-containing protein [Caldilineaceae bacterium]MBP9071226.1 DUF11 domain-containing protein [Caldilineaceae bacterium]
MITRLDPWGLGDQPTDAGPERSVILRLVSTVALALIMLGALLILSASPALAQVVTPPVTLQKVVDRPFVSVGDTLHYTLTVTNTGSAVDGLRVMDPLPVGTSFVPDSVTASVGQAFYNGDTGQIEWQGALQEQTQATIGFQVVVKPDGVANMCGGTIVNQAQLQHPGAADLLSNQVHSLLTCPDLGDAPDSTNHAGAPMTAYFAGPVGANFPTVYGPGTGPVPGPNHWFPKVDAWLGAKVSGEFDADLLPDEDTFTNLDPKADVADRDNFDDGVLKRPPLDHCKPAEMVVRVTVAAAAPVRDRFINVWFDWNRDGDWEDTFDCLGGAAGGSGGALEWAVQDFPTNLGPGSHVVTLTTFLPYNMGANIDPTMDMWARVTLAEDKAPRSAATSLADGRGPDKGYRFGETEDFHIFFENQPPVITIEKMAGVTETVPGGIIHYTVKINNSGGSTAVGLHMEDPIPAGTVYVAGSVTATLGTANYDGGANLVKWDGDLPAGQTAIIEFDVQVSQNEPPCDKGVANTAFVVLKDGTKLTSRTVHVRINCDQQPKGMDFGDASDSSNHYKINNVAYPVGPVMGRFPTVWEGTPAGSGAGPAHVLSNLLWLGDRITDEKDADLLPDADGITNILNNGTDINSADQDKADDGWLNPNVPFVDCRETTLKVRIRRSALPVGQDRVLLNVWYDGNRDGDWEDVRTCGNNDQPGGTTGTARAFEWIVQDFVVNAAAIPASGFVDIAVPTLLVSNPVKDGPAWVRFTLSEHKAIRPATTGLADGRGPDAPTAFRLGETEDYIYLPADPGGKPGEITVDKFVSGGPTTPTLGDVYTYTIDIKHVGGTAPAFVVMTDVLPAEVHLVNGPFVTELTPSVSPLVAVYDAGFGPSGRIGWQGYMTPDSALRIEFAVRVRRCPDTTNPAIINKVVVQHPDGSLIHDVETTPVSCEKPQDPQINLEKHIVVEQTDAAGNVIANQYVEWGFLSGQTPIYVLTLTNAGITETVNISDVLPAGVIAVGVSANFGLATIGSGGQSVGWTGNIGPGNSPALIKIQVKPTDRIACDQHMINTAFWWIPSHRGESNPTRLFLACSDLGDAPDSTNTPGVAMEAYPGTGANFPTVFSVAAPERGPKHMEPRPFHLGQGVTAEREADTGYDMDPTNNIVPTLKQADLDGRDDGIDPTSVAFNHCKVATIKVAVSIAPGTAALLANNDGVGYLNGWIDSNRDGDWADTFDCPPVAGTNLSFAREHIIIDFPVNVATLGPGLHTIAVPSTGLVANPADKAQNPMWLRLTLSEQKSNKTLGTTTAPYGDGRGYDTAFRLGETEDYLLRGTDQPGEADPGVTKQGRIQPVFDPANGVRGWQINWLVNYANYGSAAATNVHVIDSFSAPQYLINEQSVPNQPMTQSGRTLDYTVGTLGVGGTGSMAIQTGIPFTTPAGTVLTNTVVITSSNDGNITNNTAVVTVTVPLLPPVIAHPLPGTTCSGDITVTGRVQIGAVVDVYVDSVLAGTATPDSLGHWSLAVTGLADGSHSIYAVARVGSLTSAPTPTVIVIVDSSLFWDPMSLRFIEVTSGHVIVPSGRLDETGWSVFLKRGETYTVTLRVCCDADNPVVTMELGDVTTVNLTDPDGDMIYAGSFTTPSDGPFAGTIRICVICELIKKCSDGQVTIDPEGNVYDLTTGLVIGGSTVACMQSVVSGASGDTVYDLWPAVDFDQINPQVTAADGYFSFFTPAGAYQLQVSQTGYQPYRSWDLVVIDAPVHFDVPMTPVIVGDADHVIAITASGFEPSFLTVAPGEVVQWVNMDTGSHTSTSGDPAVTFPGLTATALLPTDGWDSGLLGTGNSYKRSLSAEGTYSYADHENPEFAATLVVAQPVVVPPSYTIFLPMVLR